MFKVSTKNTGKHVKYIEKLTIKTPKRRPVLLLLTLNIFCNLFYVTIAEFKQINVTWA